MRAVLLPVLIVAGSAAIIYTVHRSQKEERSVCGRGLFTDDDADIPPRQKMRVGVYRDLESKQRRREALSRRAEQEQPSSDE